MSHPEKNKNSIYEPAEHAQSCIDGDNTCQISSDEKVRGINTTISSLSSNNNLQRNSGSGDKLATSTTGTTSPMTATGGKTNKRGIPNKFLTNEEKEEKRKLKKRFKLQKQIHKLETRFKHAISRKDPEIENKTRLDLKQLYAKKKQFDNDYSKSYSTESTIIIEDNHNRLKSCDLPDKSCQSDNIDKDEYDAKNIILNVSKKLFSSFAKLERGCGEVGDKQITTSTTNKKQQTDCAVKLLRCMTKGTIEKSMFNNQDALIGYTRQKFNERALLLLTSMNKIRHFEMRNFDKNESNQISLQLQVIKDKIWKKIEGGHIRHACSIGCGPGNDSLGLLTFLHCINKKKSDIVKSSGDNIQYDGGHEKKDRPLHLVSKITLMDWTIEQWNESVLNSLSSILKESNMIDKEQQEETITTCFCDVTTSISDCFNVKARSVYETCDIYLISYLLSETNGKWEEFFGGIMNAAKAGALFYFAEPTPWQLHRLIEIFSNVLDFLWLDSSMYYPSLQKLDRRFGPAILFAIKKEGIL